MGYSAMSRGLKMAIVKINPIAIVGRWKSGVALDLHTIKSTPIGYNDFGYMQFETERPEIAELLYRLKNRADASAAGAIIETTAGFLSGHRDKFDAIVPVPPSYQRALQPVIVLAEGIGKALDLPVFEPWHMVRDNGAANVLRPDFRHYQDHFIPVVARAIRDFALQIYERAQSQEKELAAS